MNAQVETVLDDPIDLLLAEENINLARKRQRWNAVKDFYRPIINALQRLGIEPRFSSEIDVCFAGDAHKLAAVVRLLRTAGFATTASKPKAGDTSWSAFYKHPECQTDVYLSFSSSVCKRVKVGTKMVEQDVYETHCGDISIDESPALTIVPEVPQLVDDLPF